MLYSPDTESIVKKPALKYVSGTYWTRGWVRFRAGWELLKTANSVLFIQLSISPQELLFGSQEKYIFKVKYLFCISKWCWPLFYFLLCYSKSLCLSYIQL